MILQKPSSIPLFPYLVALFALAIAVSVVIVPWSTNATPFFIYSAGRLGAAVALFAIPALIAAGWRGLESLFRTSSNQPLFFSLIALAMVSFLNFKGTETNTRDIQYIAYDACEFTVFFPNEPIIRLMSVTRSEQEIQYAQASLALPHEYYRAECIPLALSKEDTLATLETQADAEGLSSVGYDQTSPDYVQMTGYKKIQGIAVKFIVRAYFEPHNALFLTAAADSDSYPSTNIRQFFADLKDTKRAP